MKPIERVKKVIEFKKISISAFEKSTGMSNNSIQTALKRNSNLKDDTLNSILIRYPDISAEWLLTGNGSMIKLNSNKEVIQDQINYKELAEARLETINLLKEKIAVLEAKETGHDKRKQGNAVEFRDEPRTELIREKVK